MDAEDTQITIQNGKGGVEKNSRSSLMETETLLEVQLGIDKEVWYTKSPLFPQ